MRLLFLDVDGVLNDHDTLVESRTKTKFEGSMQVQAVRSRHDVLRAMIHPKYVDRVNSILEQSKAHVVLSSSWRHIFDSDTYKDITEFSADELLALKGVPPNLGCSKELLEFFITVGFDTSTWVGVTPSRVPGLKMSESCPRGLEIQYFLSHIKTPVESIVILDDNSDMAHLTHRLVQTEGFHEGITDEDVVKAVNLFNTKDNAHKKFSWETWRNRYNRKVRDSGH